MDFWEMTQVSRLRTCDLLFWHCSADNALTLKNVIQHMVCLIILYERVYQREPWKIQVLSSFYNETVLLWRFQTVDAMHEKNSIDWKDWGKILYSVG